MKIDWKRKLSSRKFWAALAALVGAVAVFCGAGESVITETLQPALIILTADKGFLFIFSH